MFIHVYDKCIMIVFIPHMSENVCVSIMWTNIFTQLKIYKKRERERERERERGGNNYFF